MTLLKTLRGPALALALAASGLAHGQALPITGGVTSVKLVAAPLLTGAGIAVAPLGSATAAAGADGLPVASFPITGGSIDPATLAGGIEHEGSGLSFTQGATSLSLSNFFIDTVALKLFGDVAFGSTSIADLALFSIGLSSDAAFPFTLSLTQAAAGALTTLFALPDLTGATIGLAATAPITAAVPEPSTYLFMLAGLGVLGFVARRRGAVAPAIAMAA